MQHTKISVAPLYFSQKEETDLQNALVNAFVNRNRHPYTLTFKKPVRRADILIIKSDETRPRKIGEVMQRIYNADAAVFVTSAADVSKNADYEYSVGWDELDERLVAVLDAACHRDAPPPSPAETDERATGARTDSVPPRRLRVLVADDSPTARDQLMLYFSDREHDCIAVKDGETAVQEAGESEYDLILLDVSMPGINGYETCRKLKDMERYRERPVVMLTSHNSTTDRVHGIMAGCTRYLVKPVRATALDELLATLFPSRWGKAAAGTVHHVEG